MELMDGLCELENLGANHHEIMALTSDRFANTTHHHQPQQHSSQPPAAASMNFITTQSHDQSFFHSDDHVLTAAMSAEFGQQSQKEKAVGGGGRKRKRNNADKDSDKPKEVIHVRAKRGQATDSHSLAERVRREKINDRLRCLQNLVPGCYKTMGMAVMLDVVISYVQSLQNQIEFLSMKLSAASVYYDFNSPGHADAVETMQGTNAYEVQENMVRSSDQGYGGIGGGGGGVGLSFNQSTSWPL